MAFMTSRWTLANILPVAFVSWVIFTIWSLYAGLHLAPLLQLGSAGVLDPVAYKKGIVEAAISQPLALLLLACFIRAIRQEPGSVPQTAEWKKYSVAEPNLTLKCSPRSGAASAAAGGGQSAAQHEVKQTGARRYCKWCMNYKPDRCHHCRVCKSCILRMDHHCPWIANCVGFNNHKYFFLLVWYALLNCTFIILTMSETLTRTLVEETPSQRRFLIVFAITLASIMMVLLGFFLMFHVWLMLNAMTTIEFCEKRSRRGGAKGPNYERGVYENLKSVLGPYVLLWGLPLSPPVGDGLSFRLATPPSSLRSPLSGPLCPEDTPANTPDASPPEVTGKTAAAA